MNAHTNIKYPEVEFKYDTVEHYKNENKLRYSATSKGV